MCTNDERKEGENAGMKSKWRTLNAGMNNVKEGKRRRNEKLKEEKGSGTRK